MRPGCMVAFIANISGTRTDRDVGDFVTPEMLINFTFRFDALQQDPPRVLHKDAFPILDIVSH